MLLGTDKQIAAGLLLLRFAVGGYMLVHGVQKIMGFGQLSDVFPDPLGVGSQVSLILAITAEAGCSVLLILGVFTRLAVIPPAITMGIAAFVIHAADPWQKKELAYLFLSLYVVLFVTGPGRYSVDQRLGKRKGRSPERA